MRFEEKLLIVFVSVLLSMLANILLNRLFLFLDKRKIRNEIRLSISLLSKKMEGAIINNDCALLDPIIANILSNYGILSKDRDLLEIFDSLHKIVTFIKNNGYDGNDERRQQDMLLVIEFNHRLNSQT